MARYSKGKHSFAIDDRSGRKIRSRDMKKEWNGLWVHKNDWEEKHPQLTPPKHLNDAQNLKHPRPDIDQTNATVVFGTYRKRGINVSVRVGNADLQNLVLGGIEWMEDEAGNIIHTEGDLPIEIETTGLLVNVSIGTPTIVVT